MWPIVVFDYTSWITRYPEFAKVSSATATLFFQDATLSCDNTDASPIPSGTPGFIRDRLLNMLTAHIAALSARAAMGIGFVGHIDSATQGSVSVTVKLDDSKIPPYFAQTPYGMMFWQASAPYRLSIYAAPCYPMASPFNLLFGVNWPGPYQ